MANKKRTPSKTILGKAMAPPPPPRTPGPNGMPSEPFPGAIGDTISTDLLVYHEEMRQQAEQLAEVQRVLEDSRDRYADLYDFAPVSYVTLDANGVIEEINLTGTGLLGVERRRLIQMPMLIYILDEDRPIFLRHMYLCRRRQPIVNTELRLKPRDGGAVIPVQFSSRPDTGRPRAGHGFRTAITDLTDLKRVQSELDVYRERLRSLTSELSLTEERERRRIATALHDSLGQILALARIKLTTLGKVQGLTESPLFKEVQDLVAQSVQQTRSLTVELSPPVLYSLGFAAAIEWLAEQNRRHGIDVTFNALRRPPQMSEDLQILLFQAVRELLNNTIKHAQATHASITLRTAGNKIEILVEDDGVGFDFAGQGPLLDRGDGFGLFSVRTRLDHLGGEVRIDSRPGGGTRVTLIAPLERHDRRRAGAAAPRPVHGLGPDVQALAPASSIQFQNSALSPVPDRLGGTPAGASDASTERRALKKVNAHATSKNHARGRPSDRPTGLA